MQVVIPGEQIVFVTDDGVPTGEFGPKLASHTAHTRLHLAFSCYVFNDRGEFLVTQRAHAKKVWPDVWTNSVCGHPAPGEEMVDAIKRRLQYELGMEATDFQAVLPQYRYTTPPYNGIIENEFCPVFVARATSDVQPNPEEVDAYKWLAREDFIAAAEADTTDSWSWWCKDQLSQLKNNETVAQYTERA